MKHRRIIGLVGLVLLIGALGAGYWYGVYKTEKTWIPIVNAYKVVRTPGGMLEVATLQKTEALAWQTSWVCPLNICASLPKQHTQISALVHYTYRIPLAEYWVLEKTNDAPLRYRLKVPKPEPLLPVAVDLPSIRILNNGKVFAPSGPTQQQMQTDMQPQLETKAKSDEYISLQNAAAVKTVQEFARIWMRDGIHKIPEDAIIDVVF